METEDLPYFHGRISRGDAEQLLAGGGDGKFLTRVSTSSHGDYVLSMISGLTCLHFQIKSQGEVSGARGVRERGGGGEGVAEGKRREEDGGEREDGWVSM